MTLPTFSRRDFLGSAVAATGAALVSTARPARAIYDAEKKFVPAFDYADLPGYAVVTVAGAQVTARMFAGTGRELWRTVELTALARA